MERASQAIAESCDEGGEIKCVAWWRVFAYALPAATYLHTRNQRVQAPSLVPSGVDCMGFELRLSLYGEVCCTSYSALLECHCPGVLKKIVQIASHVS